MADVMPKVYHILVDGKPCTMTNTQGMTRDEAADYCRDKFGAERFGGIIK